MLSDRTANWSLERINLIGANVDGWKKYAQG